MTKIYRLFGLPFLTIETLETKEVERKQLSKQKPKGEILDFTPEDFEKEKDGDIHA